ncbi:ABC-three component system protein [Fusobacterium necrophorum]|uniref:ABC-three component system protein n=1 Tax=Fusobacterium necrophorum TaxID=859 RepID=UPI003FA05686
MFFHEIAEELKTYMAPSERGGIFVVQLVGDTLREPMTDEEEKMALDDKFNPVAELSLNMQDQIYEGKKFISKTRAGLICSRYDGADFAEEIDNLYDADKDHLQTFLARRGITVEIDELGSAMQDIMSQIFHGLSKGIRDVDIQLTIHEPRPSIKNLAENRIYFEDDRLIIDGETIELPIQLDESQIYEFESGYISALCNAYAEALFRDEVTVDDIPNLPRKYQANFYDQRKAYLSAESIQRSISEVYEDGENQFDILKEDAFFGIKTIYYDDYDTGYRRLLEVLKKVSDIQLTKSKLMLIKNLIGNLERLGIVHILVNDETIKSWVDPYEG